MSTLAFNSAPRRALLVLVCAAIFSLSTAPGARAADNGDTITTAVTQFLQAENADAGDRVSVTINTPTANLPACPQPQPFLPGATSRAAGRITVGIRCSGDSSTTRYIQADVTVYGSYFVASHDIASGDKLRAGDIRERQGDITRLRDHLPSNEGAIVGQQARRRIRESETLVDSMLEAPDVIDSGQRVKIVSRGPGFSITTRGRALGSAAVGDMVRVRTDSGTALSGTAAADGSVVVGP